jgi:DNA repair protein RadC
VSEKITVTSPDHAGRYLRDKIFTPWRDFEQEELWVLLMNSRHRITHKLMVYRGMTNNIVVRQAELLREAVRLNGLSLIVAHNHPSGNPEPSDGDIQMTRKLNKAANLLDLRLEDHLIVGESSWVSLRERLGNFD